MALVYKIDELIRLRSSPLAVKPPELPPAEQWMGPITDSSRNLTKPYHDKSKNKDPNLHLDSSNRRLASDRNVQRNNANPEDIILGPPKTSFMSATSVKSTSKNNDSPDRTGTGFNFKSRIGGSEHERNHEGRNNKARPRRVEGDQENEGLSSSQPRKSFSAEGAERFIFRMGSMGAEKTRDENIYRDREDQDRKERSRGAETFSRDRARDHEQDRDRSHRSHGIGRGRNEQSWFRERDSHDVPHNLRDRHSNGDKYADRSRGWRTKDKDERADRGSEKFTERNGARDDRGDRPWDRGRDKHHEFDPEWMEDQFEEKSQPRTTADFERWKEQMQGKDRASKGMKENIKPDVGLPLGVEKHKADAPLEFDSGPDKFLSLFTPKKDHFSDAPSQLGNEGARKPQIIGKASRFTSFFNAQDEPNKAPTDALPETRPQPSTEAEANAQSNAEKEAFQQLLQKLQRQTLQASGSNSAAPVPLPMKIPLAERMSGSIAAPLDLYQPYQNDRLDEIRPSPRHSQQEIQDLFTQRQIAEGQNLLRPEQMLQELVGQRQNLLDQTPTRLDQPLRTTNNEYSIGLMQGAQSTPDPQRLDPMLMRIPPKSENRQMQQHLAMDREHEMRREVVSQSERSTSDCQARPQPPPGFYDESSYPRGAILPHERQSRNPQPSQILQRPPGLEMGWERQAQLQPPQHRISQNIAPPPGLASNLSRALPIPQQIFPPGFPSGNFPPPDVMSAPPPRSMQIQPPPGLFNGPPPGFLTPGMGGFQGPEGMAFGVPYDARGPPSQGAFRRQ
ncbi:hypothetical protein K3495_g7036 [Podosphaera aphanis]|nr:hypothetical protein K3495_g7036 [Podosphaera aphanis]